MFSDPIWDEALVAGKTVLSTSLCKPGANDGSIVQPTCLYASMTQVAVFDWYANGSSNLTWIFLLLGGAGRREQHLRKLCVVFIPTVFRFFLSQIDKHPSICLC